MGIMPSDREQKWQSVIRRFGLPAEPPEKRVAAEKDKPKTGDSRSEAEHTRTAKPGS